MSAAAAHDTAEAASRSGQRFTPRTEPRAEARAGARVAGARPVGYGGRRPQLIAREVADPIGTPRFLDVHHVCDHLATVPVHEGHPDASFDGAAIFDEQRRDLLDRIRGAYATVLSPDTGLLAVQFGSPRRWQVIHTRSGVSPSYLEASPLSVAAPWTRLRVQHTDELDLPPAVIARYLAGLAGIPSVTGHVIDWTTGLTALTHQLRRWRDTDDTGHPARRDTLYSGMTGLHLAALFHAISPDPLQAASRHAVHRAVALLTHRADALLVRGRPAHHVFDALRYLDARYHHGRRRRHEHDNRTRAQLRLDRDTGRMVTLARLYAWTGEPHRAVALLRQRADQLAHGEHSHRGDHSDRGDRDRRDCDRRDGLGSTLIAAANSLATLFSPAPTELERLRVAHTGDLVIEPATHDPDHTPPERIWRILTPAHHLTRTAAGVEDFDVLAHDETHHQLAQFAVRPTQPNPLCVDHHDRDRWGPHIPNAGWAIWPATARLPSTSSQVLAVSATATRAFDDAQLS